MCIIGFLTRERQIRVVREEWLADSIAKQEPQLLESYDVVTDLSVDGKGIPWDKQDPCQEAIESLTAEVNLISWLYSNYYFKESRC